MGPLGGYLLARLLGTGRCILLGGGVRMGDCARDCEKVGRKVGYAARLQQSSYREVTGMQRQCSVRWH